MKGVPPPSQKSEGAILCSLQVNLLHALPRYARRSASLSKHVSSTVGIHTHDTSHPTFSFEQKDLYSILFTLLVSHSSHTIMRQPCLEETWSCMNESEPVH